MDDVPMNPQDGSQNLAQMMARMMTQMDDMRAEQANEREAMRVQIKALQENLASLQATPATIPQSPTLPAFPTVTVMPSSPSGQTKKKITLPDPPKFDGLRSNFRAWYLEMRNKLAVDG